jgi:hypothetical protein
VKAFKEAGPNTSDTAPGEHAQPGTPASPPPTSPAPAPPAQTKSPAEIEAEAQKNYVNALKGGTDEEFEHAAREMTLAQMNTAAQMNGFNPAQPIDQNYDITRMEGEIKDITIDLFSEIIGGERIEMNAVNKTVFAALDSDNATQKSAAIEFYEIIKGLDNDRVHQYTRPDSYDQQNTFNSLADFSGDIGQMLERLKNLLGIIDETGQTYRDAKLVFE